ncbi:hypothetical protein SAMN05421505_10840 [Sinosporangium album]|uniref:Tetratricopeptide repeat-containing protein n=1 Tax=Sinosporangium album TaxID=504805 RepID=A0A1G7X510_9ACTN|nr:hypothetical protein [Sinosporangium album]SDG79245.1 hypothetical protein SAMN05421505_10840 [Sinosporangium album]
MSGQEKRLEAIGAAAATVLRRSEYHLVRAEDVAAEVPPGGRSAVWLYNEVKSRRVLVALALHHAFTTFPAPAPWGRARTVTDLRALATHSLLHVARFHLAERALVTQVGLGIGDIANSEKRSRTSTAARPAKPAWSDGPWGRVAAAAWNGRINAYAAHLAPTLHAAASTVSPAPAAWAEQCADRLSDLAFRAFTGDPDGPAERQAAALASHWFERDLVPLAGDWVDDLAAAERVVALADGDDPRRKAAAVGITARLLLGRTPLAARAARAGGLLVDLLVDLLEQAPQDAATVRDLVDAASRHGLALLRVGDLAEAGDAFRLSADLAGEPFTDHDKAAYLARARHNLGETLLEAGRPCAAAGDLERAYLERAYRERDEDGHDKDDRGGDDAAWRRRTLTAQAHARAVSACGRVVEGVRLAEEVLHDRRAKLGGLDNANSASARVTLAETLLAAGHPSEARYHLSEAHLHRLELLPRHGYQTQYDVVKLAEIELELEAPEAALRHLDESCVTSEWFEVHGSHRLAEDARRVHALALAGTGDLAAAEHALRALLASPHRTSGDDPVALAAGRALARVLLLGGDAQAAAEQLHRVRDAERAIADDLPGQAETLLLLARAACSLDGAPAPHADAVAALARAGLDPCHPRALAAQYDHAVRLIGHGDLDTAARLVRTLTRREHLAHDRPALGDGHPLLSKALTLAARLGTTSGNDRNDQPWDEA